MSAWIDFAVYAAQLAMFLVVLPRWGARFSRAMLFDRNPQWAAANPQGVARFGRGGGWSTAMQAWGVFSVLVMLAFRLELFPHAYPNGKPDWDVMASINAPLIMVGLLMYAISLAWYFRFVKAHVPPAEQRQASLVRRSLDDFVPRWLQYPAYALALVNILSRPVVDQLQPGHLGNVWGAALMTLIVSAALFLAVVGCVSRRPNIFDRIFGDAYRRREVRVCFGLLVWATIGGFVSLWLEFNGIDMHRYGSVSAAATMAVLNLVLIAGARPWNGGDVGLLTTSAAPGR